MKNVKDPMKVEVTNRTRKSIQKLQGNVKCQ